MRQPDRTLAPPTNLLGRLLDGPGGFTLVVAPTLLLLAGFVIPLLHVLVVALREEGVAGALTGPLGSQLFVRSVRRTLLLSLAVTGVTALIGIIYALALGTAGPLLSKLLVGFLLATFWISLLVRTYAWVLVLQPAGALDTVGRWLHLTQDGFNLYQTLPGLLPPMVHIMLPYMVLPTYVALREIDSNHLRAARSLGGSGWLVLRKVVLPALRPGALAGIALVFILSLGFYVTPAFLGGPGDQLVSIIIGAEFGRLRNVGGASAMAALLLIAVLGLYVAADRWLRIGEYWGRI